MKDRLQFFPITSYAIVMGLTGFTVVLSKFNQLNWLPEFLYNIFLAISTLLFLTVSGFYILKAIKHFQEVKKDFKHKIRINFFSAISISFLLLSIAYHPLNHQISEILWWIGVVSHTFMMLHTISFWINHNFEINFFNPAWFIPVVGNILVPITGVEFMPMEFSFFYYSVGFFFWIILFAIFLNRVVFHNQLAQKFIPTLFILIAPPAIGFIAYYKITGNFDLFASFLLNIAYFFVLLIMFLYKNFKKLKFFISWWAFTFPLDAITLASILAYHITQNDIYKYLSIILMIITSIAIGIVSWKTILKIKQQAICVNED